VINPAIAGTGLKIKTVEALSQLRPVVAWPAGVEGVTPEARRFCRVATDWPEFARHVVAALTDTTALTELANHCEVLARLNAPDTVYAPLRRVLEGMQFPGPRPLADRVVSIIRLLLGKARDPRPAMLRGREP
jgi:hypothetical protein